MTAMDTPDTDTQTETPQLAMKRERKEQAAADAQAAFDAMQKAQTVVARAEAALQTRRAQAAAFEAKAQEAATAALAQGTAGAWEEERTADQAAAHYCTLAERAVAAQAEYENFEFMVQQQGHQTRLAALLDELVREAAAVRSHNREARLRCPQTLVLPGEEDVRSAANAGGVFADALAEQGVYMTFASDLCRYDIDEDAGRLIASRRGPDLAALYRGW